MKTISGISTAALLALMLVGISSPAQEAVGSAIHRATTPAPAGKFGDRQYSSSQLQSSHCPPQRGEGRSTT